MPAGAFSKRTVRPPSSCVRLLVAVCWIRALECWGRLPDDTEVVCGAGVFLRKNEGARPFSPSAPGLPLCSVTLSTLPVIVATKPERLPSSSALIGPITACSFADKSLNQPNRGSQFAVNWSLGDQPNSDWNRSFTVCSGPVKDSHKPAKKPSTPSQQTRTRSCADQSNKPLRRSATGALSAQMTSHSAVKTPATGCQVSSMSALGDQVNTDLRVSSPATTRAVMPSKTSR